MFLVLALAGCDFLRFEEKKNVSETYLDLIESSSSLDLKTLSRKDFDGKIVFVNFWASWCPPCQEEMPSLFKIAREHSDRIAVLAISQDSDLLDAKKWIALFPKSPDAGIFLISDEKKIWAQKFKVYKLPETFVFDPQGKLIGKFEGAVNFEGPEIRKIISTKID